MAQLGASIAIGSVGPGGIPDIAFSNYFCVINSPWGIANKWQICSSFADVVRLYGGLNKLTAVTSGTSADSFLTETNSKVVIPYLALKGYFEEKGNNSPGVAYVCRVVKSSGGATATVKTYSDHSATYNTTITSKWPGIHGGTVQVTLINPSPRKGIFAAGVGTISVSSGSGSVTGSGTDFQTTDVGKGIKINGNYYTITARASTTGITISPVASEANSGVSFQIGAGDRYVYVKAYHPQSGILEERDIANSADAADFSKKSQLITFALPAGGQLPMTARAAKLYTGTPGTVDAYDAAASDMVGTTSSAGAKTGLQVFNDQNLGTGFVDIPGFYDSTVRGGIKTHCETYYRQYFMSSSSGLTQTTVIDDVGLNSCTRGSVAYYYPHVWVDNPSGTDQSSLILTQPSGHIAGLCARMDRDYGAPHKSPAGELHPFVSVRDVERSSADMELVDDTASGALADFNINTLRIKRNAVCVWGLRSLSVDGNFRQLNVSRVIDYIYLVGYQILSKYTFEPITPSLFFKIKQDLDAFLKTKLFMKGALFGKEPAKSPSKDDAWFVVCDSSNNPAILAANNEIHADVNVVVTRNAERITCNLSNVAPGFTSPDQQ